MKTAKFLQFKSIAGRYSEDVIMHLSYRASDFSKEAPSGLLASDIAEMQ